MGARWLMKACAKDGGRRWLSGLTGNRYWSIAVCKRWRSVMFSGLTWYLCLGERLE
jgi:hypothetical protein